MISQYFYCVKGVYIEHISVSNVAQCCWRFSQCVLKVTQVYVVPVYQHMKNWSVFQCQLIKLQCSVPSLLKISLLTSITVWFDSLSLSILAAVSSQWLSHRPLYADGDHYGAKTDMEQLYGAWLPVSSNCFYNNVAMAMYSKSVSPFSSDWNISTTTDCW